MNGCDSKEPFGKDSPLWMDPSEVHVLTRGAWDSLQLETWLPRSSTDTLDVVQDRVMMPVNIFIASRLVEIVCG